MINLMLGAVLWAIYAAAAYYLFSLAFTLVVRGVPPVPSSRAAARIAIGIVRQHSKSDGFVLLELGCGTGRVALAFAKAFPAARIVGIERNPLALAICRFKRFVSGAWNAEFVRGDILRMDLKRFGAGFAYAYLSEAMCARLAPKLGREMARGGVCVSNKFGLPGLKPAGRRGGKYFLNGPLKVYRI